MRLGCCITPEQLDRLAAAGGEYAEYAVARTVMTDETAFAQLLAQSATAPIQSLAYNVFLPSDQMIVGPVREQQRLAAYSRQALDRIHQLTGPGAIVVVGSGRSRTYPETITRKAALDQMSEFLVQLGTLAAARQITIALEHLRRAESNLFTTFQESAEFIRQHQLPATALVIDLYHLMEEGEPLSLIDQYADLIAHAHVADSQRLPPGTGAYPIKEFFTRLRRNNYQGNCSIECRWQDFATEIGPAMAALRQAAA